MTDIEKLVADSALGTAGISQADPATLQIFDRLLTDALRAGTLTVPNLVQYLRSHVTDLDLDDFAICFCQD